MEKVGSKLNLEISGRNKTKSFLYRYGNVMASRGLCDPLFIEPAAESE